jgi:hypothetical protein
MKKFLALSVLATIFLLAPAVQAREWHGPGAYQNYYGQGQCGPRDCNGKHWRHQPRPRWGYGQGHHGNWQPQPAGWGYNQADRHWHHPHMGRQQSYYFFR